MPCLSFFEELCLWQIMHGGNSMSAVHAASSGVTVPFISSYTEAQRPCRNLEQCFSKNTTWFIWNHRLVYLESPTASVASEGVPSAGSATSWACGTVSLIHASLKVEIAASCINQTRYI